jgi:hypothetical protein
MAEALARHAAPQSPACKIDGARHCTYNRATLFHHLRDHAIEYLSFAFVATIAACAAWYMLDASPPFNSPDETARHLTATRVADSGVPWLEDELTRVDPLIRARGEINIAGRVLTAYPIVDPVLSGVVIAAAPMLALAVIAGIAATGFALAVHMATGNVLVTLWALPVFYYLAHPFSGMFWALFFTAWALVALIYSVRTASLRWLAIGSCLMSVAMLCRYQDAPIFMLALLGFMLQFGISKRVVAVASATVAAAFVVPQLAINTVAFGGPLSFGLGLHMADVIGQVESGGLIALARRAILPTDPSLEVVGRSLYHLVMILTPPLAVGAVAFLVRGRASIKTSALLVWLAMIGYTMLARSSPDVHLSPPAIATLASSITRYWVPVTIALTFAAGAGATALVTRWLPRTGVLALLGVIGVWSLFAGLDGNLQTRRASLERGATEYQVMITEHVPEAGLVYAGILDKWVVPHRRVATWWEGTAGARFDETVIANSIATHALDRPVFVLLPTNRSDQSAALQKTLYAYDLELTVAIDHSALMLFSVTPVAQ